MAPDDDKTRTYVPLTNGMMVSHYRIIEKIGAGGMGEVYLAEDTSLSRNVALKFLPPHLCRDADCRARFKREAQAAAKLDHPNIVAVFEVGEYQGRPFFSMQHVEGQTLKEILTGKTLPLERVIEIGIQICEGLQAAHEKGVTHRDIKPSNILIDSHGRARIVDFGLASMLATDPLTKTGSTLGTVGYMSPEQIRGDKIDQRTDLFSLGVVLYELITGHAPFKADSEAATLNAIMNTKPELLARFRRDISPELQTVIDKSLEKEAAIRYQHADELAANLKRLISTKTTATRKELGHGKRNFYLITAAMALLLAVVGYWLVKTYILPEGARPESGRKMLVVLPFQNLGAAEDEYFADGITDEITSRLGVIKSLGVISRTSAMQYKNTKKGLPQIAKELAVDYVLEGTIRWDKSGDTSLVRITPQLIKASDNTHVWAGNYERPLKSIFAVQADIATRIADTLGLALLGPERQSLEAKPTNNLEAYNLYLRAKDYWENKTNTERGIQLIEKAVALDSNFSQAYTLLVRFYGYQYINNIQTGKERLERAKMAAERAFRLAEGGAEGYLAMGSYYYYFSRDYNRALEMFDKALEGQPNNSELLAAIAYVQRRQGKWEEAVSNLRKALQLDPGSVSLADGLGQVLLSMHRLNDAEKVINRGLELAPDNDVLLAWKMAVMWYSGDTAGSRKALNRLDQIADRRSFVMYAEIADVALRDYKTALGLRTSPDDYGLNDSSDFYLSRAQIYGFLNDSDASRAYYDSLRMVCENEIKARPRSANTRIILAQAYAGLGRKQDAIREGKKAAELLPVSVDAVSGTGILIGLARVYVTVGEYDLAIDQLEYLLSIPSGLQIVELRMHPAWDPLRSNPRFQKLLEKYGT
jgi:eukaryotic-like serine/threonine-protein kinase